MIIVVLGGMAADAENLKMIRKIPHSGYSEGLDYYQGYLWNTLPKGIVKIDPKDGTVLQRFSPASEYSESVAWFLGGIWNVSFSDNGLYFGKLDGGALTFEKVGEVPEAHAWGITHDGKNLIMTGNYSDKLYFVDPKTKKVVRTLQTPIKDIEDLAWDGQGIWASSFTTFKGQIFRFDPKTGAVSPPFTLPEPELCPIIDGIAWDGKGLWVTGKECPSIWLVARPNWKEPKKEKPAPPLKEKRAKGK